MNLRCIVYGMCSGDRMRNLVTFTLLVSAGCSQQTQSSKPEAEMFPEKQKAIIAEVQAFQVAWNNGDAKLAASFFTEDGVRVGAFGDVQHGRVEIEAAYDKLLHQTMSGAVANMEPGTVRMLSSELAIWQGDLEIVPPAGAPSMKGYVVQVMKKTGNRWLILEAHPKFFPPAQK